MRTITLRQLSINLFKEIQDTPLEVTRYGKPYIRILHIPSSEERDRAFEKLSKPMEPLKGSFSQEFQLLDPYDPPAKVVIPKTTKGAGVLLDEDIIREPLD